VLRAVPPPVVEDDHDDDELADQDARADARGDTGWLIATVAFGAAALLLVLI
jgi:hypothetical protein